MQKDDFILGCHLLGVYPKKYDETGWREICGALSLLRVDVDGVLNDIQNLPKSKRDVDAAAIDIKKRLTTAATYSVGIALLADQYAAAPQDRQDKLWASFMNGVEGMDFPPYVLEIDPAVQEVITQNFMYMYSRDGKAIAYSRVLDEQGTVWEEVPDSEHVFSKLKGELRTKLMNSLVIRSLAKTVTVFVKQGDESQIFEHIPYWKLHKKNFERTMSHVSGKPENIAIVRERLQVYVDMLKRCYDGKLTNCELSRGMQEIPKTLIGLDENIDNMTFFYRKKIDFPMLTNDPTEPALAYFDLNNITDGPTPDFDGFLESIHPACRDSLMAAIYATFFAKCKLNQYIWIHGEGGDGKSSLLNAIAKYAGDRLSCSLSAQDMKSDFGLENTVGKRMVIMSDVKTGLTVKSGLIHNLTGHDLVSINRKNKPVISVRLNPILWIAANDAPDVNFDNRNEARRCLYIKMIEPPLEIQKKFYFVKADGTFELDDEGQKQNNGYDLEGHLVAEMPHILFKCRKAFERVCPAPYSVIKQNSAAIHIAKENCLDIDAATFNTYIQETFSFTNKDARMLQTEIFEAVAETMRNHSDKSQMTQFTKRDIRRLLTVKYGCQRKKDANGIYYMTGIMKKFSGMEPVPNPMTGRPVYTPMDAPANDGDLI